MRQAGFLKRVIAVTLGDPGGIGPEVVAKALADEAIRDEAEFLLIGSLDVLGDALERYAPGLRPTIVGHAADAAGKGVALLDTGGAAGEAHAPSREGGRAALDAVLAAVAAAMSGQVDALATGPVSKEALALAGCPHPGLTELLGHETNTRHPVMMLVGGGLRVALVTTHLALKKLPLHLDLDAVARTIRTTAESLREKFGIEPARIAVCGLNPHAGEGGMFGREEIEFILPAIEKCRTKSLVLDGPLPADTVFHQAAAGAYDAVVALYHDQGLIPVKLLAFHEGVNVTLGLPIVRTAPDHGTAFDIAGTGEANPGAMKAAIRLAIDIASR